MWFHVPDPSELQTQIILSPASRVHWDYRDFLPNEYDHSKFPVLFVTQLPRTDTQIIDSTALEVYEPKSFSWLQQKRWLWKCQATIARPQTSRTAAGASGFRHCLPRGPNNQLNPNLSTVRQAFSWQFSCFAETVFSYRGVTRDNIFRSDNLRSCFYQLFD